MDENKETSFETIAEKLKNQLGYKIGILSSVNLNHATPAAFYAHQASRNSYYEIGEEMIASEFDYFAGGGLLQPTGAEEDKTDLYQLAEEAGYKVINTKADAEALTAEDGKAIVIDETLADSDAMSYAIDLEEGEWGLADYVEKGIEVLDNDNGFFMMCEGGKIDWACHANDAATTIADTKAMDDAVGKAVEFYNEHPEETLILVTGDHETGGLGMGFAGTDYDAFLENMKNQKISYAKFDQDYVTGYKENKTDFDTVMKDVTELFGLQAPQGEEESTNKADSKDKHPESEGKDTLVMTDYEYNKLKAAYEETMSRTGEEKEFGQEEYILYGSYEPLTVTITLVMTDYEYNKLKAAYEETMSRTGEEKEFGQEEYILYGSYEPLTVTITHILNNKSGISFSSYAHTGLPVEVFAMGAGQEDFSGYYDNTDITVTITHILNNKSGISFSSYAHTGLPVEVFAMGAGQEDFSGYYDNTDIFNKMAALTGVK